MTERPSNTQPPHRILQRQHPTHRPKYPRRSSRRFLLLTFLSSTVGTTTAFQTVRRTPIFPTVNGGAPSKSSWSRLRSLSGGEDGRYGRYVRFYCFTAPSSKTKPTCLRMTRSRNDEAHEGSSSSSGSEERRQEDNNREELDERRILRLEALVAEQKIEIDILRQDCADLKDAVKHCTRSITSLQRQLLTPTPTPTPPPPPPPTTRKITDIENHLHAEIFGSAPSSITEAATAAGASILSALTDGKIHLSVDVRDAELSRDPAVLVQFIDSAVLPAAKEMTRRKGRGGAKVVFPSVRQLSEYRSTMGERGEGDGVEELVKLSTLGFDPIEEGDGLVVLVSPAPDDEEGLRRMEELIESEEVGDGCLPLLLLNHHMVPIQGAGAEFEQVYHLRLLSVQFMTTGGEDGIASGSGGMADADWEDSKRTSQNDAGEGSNGDDDNHADFEAAMSHAREQGVHQGVTRAMVIRAYPRPWHVFVDTSPDTDADFEVAATFDDMPSQDDVNCAIVECLEGSEREDELVAQQMQEALESGQLNAVSEILGRGKSSTGDKGNGADKKRSNMDGIIEDDDDDDDDEYDDDDDDYYDDWDPWWGTDTV